MVKAASCPSSMAVRTTRRPSIHTLRHLPCTSREVPGILEDLAAQVILGAQVTLGAQVALVILEDPEILALALALALRALPGATGLVGGQTRPQQLRPAACIASLDRLLRLHLQLARIRLRSTVETV